MGMGHNSKVTADNDEDQGDCHPKVANHANFSGSTNIQSKNKNRNQSNKMKTSKLRHDFEFSNSQNY